MVHLILIPVEILLLEQILKQQRITVMLTSYSILVVAMPYLSTAGTNWNLEATTGVNQYVHQFSTNSGGSYTNFPANNSNALIASVGPSLSQPFDLKTTTPTSTTGYEQRNITVTVLATAL